VYLSKYLSIISVDWDKEIEEELENQKRKKKSTSSTSSLPEPTAKTTTPITTNNIIPSPLPKPHSPKNSRSEAKKVVVPNLTAPTTSTNMDLLGLDSSPSSNQINQTSSAIPTSKPAQKTENPISDTFDFFSDAATTGTNQVQNNNNSKNGNDSLKQEEDDFFNQKSLENGAEKGKLTKDNILALYGNSSAPSPFQAPAFNANFQQQPVPPTQDAFFNFGQQMPQALFKNQIPPQHIQQQQFIPTGQPIGQPPMMANFNTNGNYGNFNSFGTMQSQQINRLNEENIRKIESLNFNNFK
jgi:stromal membrane-associated protein